MPTDDPCILWPGSYCGIGDFKYGRIGKRVYAHRFIWELFNGPIPDNMVILHACDTPLCVNPRHLRIGSQFDNIRDCIAKGRSRHASVSGEMHYRSHLTTNDVLDIRRRAHFSGNGRRSNLVALAKEYEVSHGTLWSIVTRHTWKHI